MRSNAATHSCSPTGVWNKWPDDGSRMNREVHVRLCVQRRLARSAGDSPAKARARSLVAWMAGRRETNDLKPIDRVIVKDDRESPGRSASERTGGPENEKPRRPSPQPEGEGSMGAS